MAATRRALKERHPTLPHGAKLGWHSLPLSAEYAFGGSLAWQVWYRDTTLGLTTVEEFAAHPDLPVVAFMSYQPRHRPQVVLIEPAAERAKLEGVEHLRNGRWNEAIAALDRADSCQFDRAALVFRGDVAGRRAYVLAHLGRWDEADREARFALHTAAEDVGARYVVAAVHAMRREYGAAFSQLDTLLAMAPRHEEALATRAALIALAASTEGRR